MSTITSLSSSTASVTITTTSWMLSDSADDTVIVGSILPDLDQTRPLQGGALRVLGKTSDVVVTDVVGDVRLDLTFQCLTATDQANLEALLARGKAMTLRSTRYPNLLVRLSSDVATSIANSGPSTIWRSKITLTKTTA